MEMMKHKEQLSELRKMSYSFYKQLADGAEPLTYTFRASDDANETQVEVNAREASDSTNLIVEIAFDSDYGGRFNKKRGVFYTYTLSADNVWKQAV